MTNLRLCSAAACAALLACGGSKPPATTPPGDFVDGTRLAARSFTFPGTEPLFVGVHDTQDQLDCTFAKASDGKLRCLPGWPIPSDMGAPERWVEGTETPGDEPTTRVRSYRMTTTDGGRFPSRWSGELYDATAARPCRPVARGANQPAGTRCLPNHVVASGNDFADAACSEPLAMNWSATEMPALIVQPDGALHAVGSVITGLVFSNLVGGVCSSLGVSTLEYFRVGERLPEDAVPAIDVVERGGGRLALRTLESEGRGLSAVRYTDDKIPWAAGTGPYRDRELGIPCQPIWTVSGDVRCLPADADYVSEESLENFADPACTERLMNYTSSDTAVILRKPDGSDRQLALEVRRVDAATNPTAYTMRNGICTEYLKGAGRRLGAAVPLSSFARLEPSSPL